MSKKGLIGEGIVAILLGAGIAIASVLIFFYVFKVDIELQMREHFIWNKVQEVPLDLLSMDVDGEPFVVYANKVYYGLIKDKNQFRISVHDKINNQIFYFFEEVGEEHPFSYEIYIFDVLIDEKPAWFDPGGCGCTEIEGGLVYLCNDECGAKAGEFCGFDVGFDSLCFDTVEKYQAEYPVPLTFDGTNDLVDKIFYKVVEYHV